MMRSLHPAKSALEATARCSVQRSGCMRHGEEQAGMALLI